MPSHLQLLELTACCTVIVTCVYLINKRRRKREKAKLRLLMEQRRNLRNGMTHRKKRKPSVRNKTAPQEEVPNTVQESLEVFVKSEPLSDSECLSSTMIIEPDTTEGIIKTETMSPVDCKTEVTQDGDNDNFNRQ